jgi:polyferredoxin
MKMAMKQRIIQLFFSLLYNSYILGFFLGGIYQGRLKLILCPGFNCHSCPSAIFSCPIGAIQLFASIGYYHFSLYVFGFLATIGAVGGRIVCGWACPFGFIQDILYKLKTVKVRVPKILHATKYFVLFILVLAVPYFTKEPWFCKLCPIGTFEAGIPLMLINKDLRDLIGLLFYVKIAILMSFIFWMIISQRPFCKTACPLGAIYSLFNKFSIIKLEVNEKKCVKCGLCVKECPVSIKINEEGGDSANCIRCFRCSNCPTKAISIKLSSKFGK